MLLALEGIHFDRQFGGDDEILEVDTRPALELGAVGQVRILGDSVVFPAARVSDGGHAPHAGRAAEVEEGLGAVAGGVLEDEVPVEQNGLDLGQERELAVEVGPATLDEGHFLIREVGNSLAEEVLGGQEVGIEHGHQLALGDLEALGQRPGLEARAVRAMQVVDVKAQGPVTVDHGACHLHGVVSGIVQNLDLELVLGPVHLEGVGHKPLDDIDLVEHGQLDRDHGEIGRIAHGLGHVFLVAIV